MTIPDDPIHDRESLGFADEAVGVFSEFLGAHGFSLTHRETTLVDFSSQSVIVRLTHGRSSYEVNLEAAPRRMGLNSEPLFGIHEMLTSIVGEKEARRLTHADNFRASTRDSIRRALIETLELAKRHLDPGLGGDEGWWRQVQATREEMSRKYTEASRIRSLKAQARIAWENGDYPWVISALESIKGHLSDEEEEKLDQARIYVKNRSGR